MLEYTLENELYEQGYKFVCGVDDGAIIIHRSK